MPHHALASGDPSHTVRGLLGQFSGEHVKRFRTWVGVHGRDAALEDLRPR